MEYREVQVEEYNPVGSFREGSPFTLAFCRTMNYGNVLVKGGATAVGGYIERNLGPCLVSFSYWCKGRSRNFVQLVNCPPDFRLCGAFFNQDKNFYVWNTITRKVLWGWRRLPATFPRELKVLLS